MTDQQFTAIMERLTQICALLAYAIEGPAPSTEPVVCEHPADQLEDLSTMTRKGFYCRACGFESVVDRRTGEPIAPRAQSPAEAPEARTV